MSLLHERAAAAAAAQLQEQPGLELMDWRPARTSTTMTGGSRFGIIAPYQRSQEALSPMGGRAFLVRFAEPITAGKHEKTGATPRRQLLLRRMKARLDEDITVGGPGLAAHALRGGLVDECRLFLNPVVVGGGTPSLPGGVRLDLELLEERRFGNGVVYLRYHVMA